MFGYLMRLLSEVTQHPEWPFRGVFLLMNYPERCARIFLNHSVRKDARERSAY